MVWFSQFNSLLAVGTADAECLRWATNQFHSRVMPVFVGYFSSVTLNKASDLFILQTQNRLTGTLI